MATLESPGEPPPTVAWQPSARRRVAAAALTLLAVGLAIAIVATGPAAPVSYGVRLPLLALAGGGLASAAAWRRRVHITADEVVLRTLVRVRTIPLSAVARLETDDSRVTIRTLSGRKAVIRAAGDPYAAVGLANAIVTAAGPTASLAEGAPAPPVPMATPWLIALLTIGVALLTAKGLAAAAHPMLIQRVSAP